MNNKPIHEYTYEVTLKWWGCDTTCCGMGHYEVWGKVSPTRAYQLAETRTICYETGSEQEDCLKELREIFDTYKIPKDYLNIENFWDLDDWVYRGNPKDGFVYVEERN